jgi:DNA modification methylase
LNPAAKSLLIQGDARRLPLAAGSVHCCVTSPPYWSLRDYGLEPTVWGGDDSCAHEWASEEVVRELRRGVNLANSVHCTRGGAKKAAKVGWQRFERGTCVRCGAWRGCLGLEPTPELYIAHLVLIFREVRRVLRDDGTLFLNIGDSYAAGGKGGGGSFMDERRDGAWQKQSSLNGWKSAPPGLKGKDLVGIPWMLAFALRADGWYLRQDIIWSKPNPMPESVTDRCTKAHEYLFLLTKAPRYFYDADAIREPVTSTGGASFGKQNHDATGTGAQSRALDSPAERNHPLGRNKRSVWHISTQSFPEAHFATYPVKLVLPCIRAGTARFTVRDERRGRTACR